MRRAHLFASDNTATVHPAVMEALARANQNHEISYGDDPYTREAEQKIRELFDAELSVFFVYNGTGANVLALASMVHSWEATICTEIAHLYCDETGAPERITGAKLLPVRPLAGKLTVDQLRPFMGRRGFEHTSQPRAVSLTESTEVGTCYTPEEIREIADFCREEGLYLHMDGARISNAAVSLADRRGSGSEPRQMLREITSRAGVDVLSFGLSKNGIMFGEAVVFFRQELAAAARFLRKQATQLNSKMRYIASQYTALIEDDLWARNARHANALAARLADRLTAVEAVELAYPVEANGVFPSLPDRVIAALQEEWGFYTWEPEASVVRLMLCFDSTEEDVDLFCDAVEGVG
ncbi:MAG: threonine aldolase family protein [Alkalispirochaetaceae bacterium]